MLKKQYLNFRAKMLKSIIMYLTLVFFIIKIVKIEFFDKNSTFALVCSLDDDAYSGGGKSTMM